MPEMEQCPTCKGEGGFPSGVENVMGAPGEFQDECEECSGTGKISIADPFEADTLAERDAYYLDGES